MNHVILRAIPLRRFTLVLLACIALFGSAINVSASRKVGRHKGLSRLTAGLRSVQETASRARQRLAALNKREDALQDKIDQIKGREELSAEEDKESTISYANDELTKIRYERKALTKKIKECTLNRRCILAEIEVVKESMVDVEPLDPLLENIQLRRPIKGRITNSTISRLRTTEKA